MSAKSIISTLQDSQLIRTFLNFVQTYRLQYQKSHKEISYKCYEATWMLSIARATGYGRTETEAYKSALKNLMELVMEDPKFGEYFEYVIDGINQRKENIAAKPQLKTEGNEKEEYERKMQHLGRARLETQASGKENCEVERAKAKMMLLQSQLASVLHQNKILKQRLNNNNKQPSFTHTNSSKVCTTEASETTNTRLHKKCSQQSFQKCQTPSAPKISIPKLNLHVLPNYHKKSQKCLNEQLLLAYKQKHGEVNFAM